MFYQTFRDAGCSDAAIHQWITPHPRTGNSWATICCFIAHLHCMQLLNSLLQTNESFLLGRWLQSIPAWASSTAELAQLNYDAPSILTTWGNRKASEFGLRDYANRDWPVSWRTTACQG